MIRGEKCLYASCRYYPLVEAAKAQGRALCPWFETMRGWNDPACVLHDPAKDRDARKRIVIELMKETKT